MMYLQYINFNFEADFMQPCPGNKSVSKFQSVTNAVSIHRYTLTLAHPMQQHTPMTSMHSNIHVHYNA